jgi:hypothetical protein
MKILLENSPKKHGTKMNTPPYFFSHYDVKNVNVKLEKSGKNCAFYCKVIAVNKDPIDII